MLPLHQFAKIIAKLTLCLRNHNTILSTIREIIEEKGFE
jgi:hypothetical protein